MGRLSSGALTGFWLAASLSTIGIGATMRLRQPYIVVSDDARLVAMLDTTAYQRLPVSRRLAVDSLRDSIRQSAKMPDTVAGQLRVDSYEMLPGVRAIHAPLSVPQKAIALAPIVLALGATAVGRRRNA